MVDELMKISNRGYTTGFAFSEEKINETSRRLNISKLTSRQVQCCNMIPSKDDAYRCPQSSGHRRWSGATIAWWHNQIDTRTLLDANEKSIKEANNDNKIYLPLEREAPVGTVLRQKVK